NTPNTSTSKTGITIVASTSAVPALSRHSDRIVSLWTTACLTVDIAPTPLGRLPDDFIASFQKANNLGVRMAAVAVAFAFIGLVRLRPPSHPRRRRRRLGLETPPRPP